MTILYSAGPVGNSLKVLITAAEKRLSLSLKPIDAIGLEQHRAPLSQLTPTGSLPVLVDGELVLTESSVINEYLDEVHSEPRLMPDSVEDRWRARVWFKFVNEDLAPAVSILAWRTWSLPALSQQQRAVLRSSAEAIEALERRHHWQQALIGFPEAPCETIEAKLAAFLALTEKSLADADYLAGERFSLADIDVWPFIEPLRRLRSALLKSHPRTDAWVTRVLARPAIGAAYENGRDDLWVPGPELIRWG